MHEMGDHFRCRSNNCGGEKNQLQVLSKIKCSNEAFSEELTADLFVED